ncbi:hypothetical protein D3C86_584640 [compost metagenome]
MGLEPGHELLLRLRGEAHRQRRCGGLGGEATPGVGQAVGIGNIGLDIDHRGAVQQIHGAEIEPQLATLSAHPVQLDHGEAEGIGAEGGASGKDPDPLVAAEARRTYRRVPALGHGLVKHEAEPEVGKLLYAPQHIRLIVGRQQLQAGAGRFDQAGLAGDGELLLVGRADDP